MGCDDCDSPDAEPAHLARLTACGGSNAWDNAEFAKTFRRGNRDATMPERTPDPKIPPRRAGEKLAAPPGCAVSRAAGRSLARGSLRMVALRSGAQRNNPDGPGSSTQGREDHLQCKSLDEAVAYGQMGRQRIANRSRVRFAARGGLDAIDTPGQRMKPSVLGGQLLQRRLPRRK